MNAHEILKGNENEGSEIAGNIQEMILSQALQGCLMRLESCVPNRSRAFFANGNISKRYSKVECLKA